jgi:hypothetical protein
MNYTISEKGKEKKKLCNEATSILSRLQNITVFLCISGICFKKKSCKFFLIYHDDYSD